MAFVILIFPVVFLIGLFWYRISVWLSSLKPVCVWRYLCEYSSHMIPSSSVGS